MSTTDDVRALYKTMIDAWNAHDADAFAAVFDADGEIIGAGGSEVRGPDAIAAHLRDVFGKHAPRYVTIVRGVQQLVPQAGVLRAVVGLGAGDPAFAIHRLVVVQRAGIWRCALLQNTPVTRLEDIERLTGELRATT